MFGQRVNYCHQVFMETLAGNSQGWEGLATRASRRLLIRKG
jgi:hypothetical protein